MARCRAFIRHNAYHSTARVTRCVRVAVSLFVGFCMDRTNQRGMDAVDTHAAHPAASQPSGCLLAHDKQDVALSRGMRSFAPLAGRDADAYPGGRTGLADDRPAGRVEREDAARRRTGRRKRGFCSARRITRCTPAARIVANRWSRTLHDSSWTAWKRRHSTWQHRMPSAPPPNCRSTLTATSVPAPCTFVALLPSGAWRL